MYFHSTQSLQAEIAYRQERIKRDFQRPWFFTRKAVSVPAQPVAAPACRPVQARHAM